MSVMSDIDIELQVYWQADAGGWSRQLPNGQTVTIVPWSSEHPYGSLDRRYGYKVMLGRGVVWASVSTLPEAITAAGNLARHQLAEMSMTWA